VEDLTGEGNP